MRREFFKAYYGRYTFDVDKAYDLINQGRIKADVIDLNSRIAQSLIFFTGVHDEHVGTKDAASGDIDGLMVKFSDPDHPDDTMIIDGNHRINSKIRASRPTVKLLYIKNPSDTKKFLTIDRKKPKELFPEEDAVMENEKLVKTFEEFLNEKKESPYSEETLKKYKEEHEKGKKIPFAIERSLKAQGMIPRVDGTTRKSDMYK
jgi:hypothetical protein